LDIAILRKALGLSQVEFGHLLGVHLMTVSKWERGVAQPSPYQVALLREFKKAAAASGEQIKTEIKTRLVGRGVAAALLMLLAAAAENDKELHAGTKE
jgi:putative transcriptional regulator